MKIKFEDLDFLKIVNKIFLKLTKNFMVMPWILGCNCDVKASDEGTFILLGEPVDKGCGHGLVHIVFM